MERIHVSVRPRPLSQEDVKSSPWRISGNSISLPNHSPKFEFDRIFQEECKTVEVYEAHTKEIVAAAVRGFNGTVFAYGQTNSGKTHTMRGSVTEPGVIRLAVHDLFDIIQEDMDREFLLRMSYMEIYNEEINDLLAPEHGKLQIHESIERGIFVAGLREEIVVSPDQVLQLMEFGESHRHTGETNMNVYSSRSHTIFRMIIESRDKIEDEDSGSSCDAVRVSVMNLVDLAGSERAAKTGAEGVRLKEGSHINKSLMTLGTVIKKLSEGAESQGGHVPYRDSKLTRILQPALGGNANTAIICNITLAQIHADETKSSLQFASRALRVTNCAHVNEILTDAALLKRQKKEIEELRAKLQGSHSEHFEEEILNLRNTLLQTELERERIAMELEEEKKAQAEREKRLQEQAKKIENLSSMVLCSNRDGNHDYYKKEKRRDTWCPGKLSRETLGELYSTVKEENTAVKPTRAKRDMGPLLIFEELLNEANVTDACKQEEDFNSKVFEDRTLPDPRALLHVTSRRKLQTRNKSSPVENSELEELQAEYEKLLLKFETQRTMSDMHIDYLTKKLAEADIYVDEKKLDDFFTDHNNRSTIHADTNISTRESEAILTIKQLQEKIEMLEMEKFSSQQNLDCIVEQAEEQNICAREKYEELYDVVLNAREEARVTREQLSSMESRSFDQRNIDPLDTLVIEIQDIVSGVQTSGNVVESVSSVVDEVLQSFSSILNLFNECKLLTRQNSEQVKSIVSNFDNLHCSMRQKVTKLENEKLLLFNQSADLHNQIHELSRNIQNSEKELSEHELEKSELLSQVQVLEKEISYLSISSLAKEKENIRKELEKTKTKLRDTESKLRNAIQDKTRLEGEKASAEREIKRLHSQKALLERDFSKRDSLAGKRRDSVLDRSSNVFDPRRAKGLVVSLDQTMQDDYKKLEVLAFEMETTIASLEEDLAAANGDKEQVISQNENLTTELQVMADKLEVSNSELIMLQEEVSTLRLNLEESKSHKQNLESSVNKLVGEKEELAMQLTEALLAMEEEKAILSAKERASIEAIEEKAKFYNAEIMLLSEGMSEVSNELESCREECRVLSERLMLSEENAKLEKKCSGEMSLENDRLRNDLIMEADHNKRSQEILKSRLETISLEHRHACEEMARLQMELDVVNKEKEDLSTRIMELDARSVRDDDFQNIKNRLIEAERNETCNDKFLKATAEVEELTVRLSQLEVKMHDDEANNRKETVKLRMRLRGAQAKLDNFRVRYREAVDEMDLMNRKYEEASAKLKERLASYGIEVLNLKKQLAAAKGQ